MDGLIVWFALIEGRIQSQARMLAWQLDQEHEPKARHHEDPQAQTGQA